MSLSIDFRQLTYQQGMECAEKLENLVAALKRTSWSSWQTTAQFQDQLDAGEYLLKQIREYQNADR